MNNTGERDAQQSTVQKAGNYHPTFDGKLHVNTVHVNTRAEDIHMEIDDKSVKGHPNSTAATQLDYPTTGDSNFIPAVAGSLTKPMETDCFRSHEAELIDLSIFRNITDSSMKHGEGAHHSAESHSFASNDLPFGSVAQIASSAGPYPAEQYAGMTSHAEDYDFETMLRSVQGGDHDSAFMEDMSSFNFELPLLEDTSFPESDGINLKSRENRKRHSTAPCSLLAPSRTGSLSQDFMSSAFSLPPPPVVRARRKSRGKPDSIFLLLKKNGMTDGKTWSRARSCSLRHADQAMFKPSRSALLSPSDKSKSDEAIQKTGLPAAASRNGKSRFKPLPLIIPPYVFFNRFQSQLRSPSFSDNNGISMIGVRARTPYTPPPILSPLRRGSGLFCRIRRPSPVAPKSAPVCYSRKESFWENLDLSAAVAAGSRKIDDVSPANVSPPDSPVKTDSLPHINVGTEYQASVPSMPLDPSKALSGGSRAVLLFDPNCLNHLSQDSVQALLSVACSPVVHGGGTNTELALHLLHDSGGDVQKAANRLTAGGTVFDKEHPLHDYTYNDCQQWTEKEIIQFENALLKGDKDFNEVSAAVGTKSVADCIAFYYSWKIVFKRSYQAFRVAKQRREFLQFGRLRSPDAGQQPAVNEQSFSPVQTCTGVYGESAEHFPCNICGKVFYKIKSRSAHMKIHYRS
uniref:C2H2-type domain-containing protein n=1 Tax=Trichuris muris TaxID=70415 RepID=A0A5S6QYQ7_TRIMR